jgi:hypothetical protein
MASKTKKVTRSRQLSHAHPGHKHPPKHFTKVYWPYIPLIALVIMGLVGGMGIRPGGSASKTQAVLAYAAEMSQNGLLSGTNAERTSRGLPAFSLNSKLNQAAQAKANDMVARDYWSHNTPDGEQPWVFFKNAGYAYKKAGENLAYGFSTSNETIVGWMNSDGHRANILDTSYKDVGFGFANSANFVGTGNETIVVAMYGDPQVLAAATPPPAPSTPKPATATTTPAPAAAAEQAPTPAPEESTPEPDPEPIPEQFTSETPVADTEATRITRLQSLTKGSAPWSAAALSAVSVAIVGLWLAKHALIVKRAVISGEDFVLHHPLIDIAVAVFVALAVILTSTTGVIK